MLSWLLSTKRASLPKTQYCVSRRPLVRSHPFSLWRGLIELNDLTKPSRIRWPVDRADSTPQHTHMSASSIWAVRIGHPGENIVLFLFHDHPIRLDKSCNILAFLGSESHQFVRPLWLLLATRFLTFNQCAILITSYSFITLIDTGACCLVETVLQ